MNPPEARAGDDLRRHAAAASASPARSSTPSTATTRPRGASTSARAAATCRARPCSCSRSRSSTPAARCSRSICSRTTAAGTATTTRTTTSAAFRFSVTGAPNAAGRSAAGGRPRDPRDPARQAHARARCEPSSATGGRPSPSGAKRTSRSRRCGSEHPEGSSQLVLHERADDPRQTHMLDARRLPASPAKRSTPGVPAFLQSAAGRMRRRIGLTFARWLVDRRSPTTARSIVNRVWQAYFGTGLVSHRRGSRHAGRAAVASRAARLAGRRVHGSRLEPEAPAPADRHVGDLPAVVARHAGAAGPRSGQSPAGARPALSASTPRSCATSRWPPAGC